MISDRLPGPALDRLIHEQVLGLCAHVLTGDIPETVRTWKTTYHCTKCGQSGFDYQTDYEGRIIAVPPYSTDLTAAGTVIEHLMTLGYSYVIKGNWQGDGQHWVGFDEKDWADPHPLYQSGPCASIPLAICTAALEVMTARKIGENI